MTVGNPTSAISDRVGELHARLERQVSELVTTEDWRRMLDTACRFHRYSANNVMLIMAQRPEATRVAGFQAWKAMGRWVRKGERGIQILAPMVIRLTDEDGDEQVRVMGFRVVHVFALEQTDGKPLPDIRPALLDGQAPTGAWDALAAHVRSAGFTVSRGDCHGANGVTRFTDRTIVVRDDVSNAQAFKTLVHEAAHVLLGHEGQLHECRGRLEVEAESVAFVVCQASGMTTGEYSLPYVAHWSAGDITVVRDTAERVISCASAILAAIEGAERPQEAA